MKRRRIPLYFVEAAEGGAEGQEQQPAQGGGEAKPEAKADEGKTFTQADVDRIIAGRLAKFSDYDDLRSKLSAVEDANASEAEKAVKAAREEARREALAESAPRLVQAEFRVASAGRMDKAQLDAYLEDIDPNKYLTESGEVDTDRIVKKIDALAPAGEQRPPVPPSFGGGPRAAATKPDPGPGLARIAAAYAENSK